MEPIPLLLGIFLFPVKYLYVILDFPKYNEKGFFKSYLKSMIRSLFSSVVISERSHRIFKKSTLVSASLAVAALTY